MNSLPLIHHHLFVAAIGNEGRACPAPPRAEKRPLAATAEPARLLAFEVADEAMPIPAEARHLLRESITSAGA